VTAALDRAYANLGHARAIVDDIADVGTVARMEQAGAAARDVLATYGIDLDQPGHLDVAVAIVDVLTRAVGFSGATGLMETTAQLQQCLASATRHHDRNTR
jgi:hypothetical protein